MSSHLRIPLRNPLKIPSKKEDTHSKKTPEACTKIGLTEGTNSVVTRTHAISCPSEPLAVRSPMLEIEKEGKIR